MPIKKMIFIILLLGIHIATPVSKASPTKTVALSQLNFQSLNSNPTDIKKEFKGKILLLDFWASWCDPCKESLPFYEKLQKKWAPQGLEIIAVSVDDEIAEARDFIAKQNFKLRFLWDQNKTVAKKLSIQAIPTTLIINSDGQILHTERGFLSSSKANFEKKLQEILKNPLPDQNSPKSDRSK